VGDVEARMVFHLGPLAPRPELGHVDTEHTETADRAAPPERTEAAS
jgi:putative monooxygenase